MICGKEEIVIWGIVMKNNSDINQYLKNKIKNEKSRVIIYLFISIFKSLILFLPSIITGYLVDIVIPQGSFNKLWIFSSLLVVVPILISAMIIIENYLITFVIKISGEARIDIFNGIQCQSLEWLDKFKIGDLLNRLINEIDYIVNIIFMNSGFFIWHVVTIVAGAFLIIYLNLQIGIITTTLLVIKLIVIKLFKNKQINLASEANRIKSEMIEIVRENINANEYIKFVSLEQNMIDKFNKVTDKFYEKDLKQLIYMHFGNLVNVLITGLCVYVIFALGSYNIVRGCMTSGQLITLFNAFLWTQQAYNSFYSLLTEFIKIKPLYKRIKEIYNPIEDNYMSSKESLNRFELVIKDLNYRIKNEKILYDINLKIKESEKVALIGPSGCGKSVLADIIMGFRSNYEGSMTVDDKNLLDKNNEWIRNEMMIVSQNYQFRSGTILENIVYTTDVTDIDKINNVINIVGLEKWIKKLPKGLNTDLGDSGTNISGGEKQRLALARALLMNPRFIILDEVTSSLDNITAQAIVNRLFNEYVNLSVLFITHDSNIVTQMDRTIRLEDGHVLTGVLE